MKVYVEVLLLVVPVVMFAIWFLWYHLSTKRLSKKYKPENDKSKKGGIPRGTFEAREPEVAQPTISSPRDEQPERRELLSTSESDFVGEDSISSRRNRKSSSIGKLLRRKK